MGKGSIEIGSEEKKYEVGLQKEKLCTKIFLS